MSLYFSDPWVKFTFTWGQEDYNHKKSILLYDLNKELMTYFAKSVKDKSKYQLARESTYLGNNTNKLNDVH